MYLARWTGYAVQKKNANRFNMSFWDIFSNNIDEYFWNVATIRL